LLHSVNLVIIIICQ